MKVLKYFFKVILAMFSHGSVSEVLIDSCFYYFYFLTENAINAVVLISVPKKCQKAREHFATVKTQLASLKNKFPVDQYYRLVSST